MVSSLCDVRKGHIRGGCGHVNLRGTVAIFISFGQSSRRKSSGQALLLDSRRVRCSTCSLLRKTIAMTLFHRGCIMHRGRCEGKPRTSTRESADGSHWWTRAGRLLGLRGGYGSLWISCRFSSTALPCFVAVVHFAFAFFSVVCHIRQR